jgi:type III secretion protein T
MILMTDFFLGIANRLAPQVQITFLGMPLKSLLALFIIFLGWKLINDEMVKQGYYWINEVMNMLRMVTGSVSDFNVVKPVQ